MNDYSRKSVNDGDLQVAVTRRQLREQYYFSSEQQSDTLDDSLRLHELSDRQKVALRGSSNVSPSTKTNKHRKSATKSKQRRSSTGDESFRTVSPKVQNLGGFSMENQFKKKNPAKRKVKIDASVSPYRRIGSKPTINNTTGDGIFKALKEDKESSKESSTELKSFHSRASLIKKNAELRHTIMGRAGLVKSKIGRSLRQMRSSATSNVLVARRSTP